MNTALRYLKHQDEDFTRRINGSLRQKHRLEVELEEEKKNHLTLVAEQESIQQAIKMLEDC